MNFLVFYTSILNTLMITLLGNEFQEGIVNVSI